MNILETFNILDYQSTLTETYSPKLKISSVEKQDAKNKFWKSVKSIEYNKNISGLKIVDTYSFHIAFDDTLQQLDALSIFLDNGLLYNRKAYGEIVDVIGKKIDMNDSEQKDCLQALKKLWAVQFTWSGCLLKTTSLDPLVELKELASHYPDIENDSAFQKDFETAVITEFNTVLQILRTDSYWTECGHYLDYLYDTLRFPPNMKPVRLIDLKFNYFGARYTTNLATAGYKTVEELLAHQSQGTPITADSIKIVKPYVLFECKVSLAHPLAKDLFSPFDATFSIEVNDTIDETVRRGFYGGLFKNDFRASLSDLITNLKMKAEKVTALSTIADALQELPEFRIPFDTLFYRDVYSKKLYRVKGNRTSLKLEEIDAVDTSIIWGPVADYSTVKVSQWELLAAEYDKKSTDTSYGYTAYYNKNYMEDVEVVIPVYTEDRQGDTSGNPTIKLVEVPQMLQEAGLTNGYHFYNELDKSTSGLDDWY